jgi:N-formylmaleamate deformylase
MGNSTFQYGANVLANGIRQHYLRFGGARGQGHDPVIIVPGITSPAITWGFVGEVFGRQLDTYILDVRGRGLSAAGDALDYSLDAQARDLIGFAQTLGLERYSVVGHSMGARIAIRACAKGAPGMARIVAVDPPVSGPGRRRYPSDLNWYVDSIREAQRGMSAEAMRKYCPTWTQAQLTLRAEWLHTCDLRATVASYNGFHDDDIHADLSKVALPLRLLVAEKGGVIQATDLQEICRLAPQCEVTHVAGAGHMIPWDQEAGFYAAMADFLGPRVHIDTLE